MADPAVVKKHTPETQQINLDLKAGSQLLAWIEFWNLHPDDPSWYSARLKLFYTARLCGNTILNVASIDQKTPQASTNEIVK
jgi:hypothetical protein